MSLRIFFAKSLDGKNKGKKSHESVYTVALGGMITVYCVNCGAGQDSWRSLYKWTAVMLVSTSPPPHTHIKSELGPGGGGGVAGSSTS